MSKPLFSHVMNLRAADVLWTSSGGTLKPSDPSKLLSIPAGYINFGTACDLFMFMSSGAPVVELVANYSADAAYVSAKPSWFIRLSADTDHFEVWRQAASAGAYTIPLYSTAVGDLVIAGNNATKATGTTWINPSDPRLKTKVVPYPRGLAEVLQLQPIAYEYNGLAGTQEGQPAVGLDTEAVEPIFPECVQTRDVLLHPDDPAPTTIRLLDISAILFALINAIKELRELIPGPPV